MKLLALAAMVACSHGDPPPAPSPPLPFSAAMPAWMLGATDLVTAVSDDWGSTKVTLSQWKRDDRFRWKRVGDPWPGVVGNAGLAWGIGLHGSDPLPGPTKKEGDSKAPAGAFRLRTAFGLDDQFQGRVLASELPFRKLDEQTECVDDPRSASYNQIVEHTGSADWSSSEHMHSVAQYEIGAVVDHNPARVPGAGSCIFLHVWSGPDSTTVGCTAMEHDKLASLLSSLGKEPVFVELPRTEYQALQAEWGLPPQ